MRWDENAHMGEDPWCTRLHICGDILCNRKKRSLQQHHGERRIESIHTARKVRREEAAKKEDFFWRRRTSHLKPSNTSQRQVLLGEITWNLHLLISIWFYIVFLKILVLSCWLVWTERATNCFVEIGCLLVCPESVCDLSH